MVNNFFINSNKNALKKLPTAILPFAAGKTMLCRRLFDALPSAINKTASLGVRLALSGSPLGSDSPSAWLGLPITHLC